eukprot:CAMPEP_0197451890 /NCGR_PEP_ID=MMETSP1175-20131217/30443_1 /TAXON_ID=1003142 /ORGANISM="Triceratium dubium, Strain CCMP147" /LENGTH=66 /DNA_ID=CAMNT_0042984753 /DNA_START=888 /DNA_END=1088 /DNA_ORIENTATION=+
MSVEAAAADKATRVKLMGHVDRQEQEAMEPFGDSFAPLLGIVNYVMERKNRNDCRTRNKKKFLRNK